MRPEVTLHGADGRVRAHVDVEGGEGLTLRASVAGVAVQLPVGDVVDIAVPNPAIWWPHGLGSQPLYDLVVELLDEAGAITDSWQRKIGLRSLRLDTSKDDKGRPSPSSSTMCRSMSAAPTGSPTIASCRV